MNDNPSSVGADRRQYYSSSQGPFHDAENLLTFYGGAGRGAIVDAIIRERRETHQLVQVHGEEGSGRTFLSLVLADRLKHACNVIRYENNHLSVTHLLRHLLIELCPREAHLIAAADLETGIEASVCEEAACCIEAQLERRPPGNKPYLLTLDVGCIPESKTMALLQRFAAVSRGQTSAMLIVLFRPEPSGAERRTRESTGRAMRTRDGDVYDLRRLSLSETGDYLRHQMLLFDFNRRDLFTHEMTYFVADQSKGVLGAIDNLARNAFMLASLEDDERPSLAHLLAAGLPMPDETPQSVSRLSRHRASLIALFGLCVVASTALVVLLNA